MTEDIAATAGDNSCVPLPAKTGMSVLVDGKDADEDYSFIDAREVYLVSAIAGQKVVVFYIDICPVKY